jgi:hypothetical protein
VWVGNLGRAGLNSRDHVGAMRLVIDQYEPDAVVLLLGGNDLIDRLGAGDTYDPYFVENEPRYYDWLKYRFALVPLVTRSHGDAAYERTALWQLGRWLKVLYRSRRQILMDAEGRWLADARAYRQRAIRADALPALGSALDEYERNIGLIVDEARRRSIQIVFVTQPTFWKDAMSEREDKLLFMGLAPARSDETLDWPPSSRSAPALSYAPRDLTAAMATYNRRLLQTCDKLKVECVDLASRIPRTMDMYFDDMHYTEQGAHQFAIELVRYIKTTNPFAPALPTGETSNRLRFNERGTRGGLPALGS